MNIKNILEGKILRYLIGANDGGTGKEGEITVVPYGAKKVRYGISVAYCNLFDELNTGEYGPYLKTSDTAKEYNEGQIDPAGPGWFKNLQEQFVRCKSDGFGCVELDNPDAYNIEDVLRALDHAARFGFSVLAKNAGLFDNAEYLKHKTIAGCIVEKGCGGAILYDFLRKTAGKPNLPIWFVFFGNGAQEAHKTAEAIEENGFHNMGVTFSPVKEYTRSLDIYKPIPVGK